MKLLRTAVSDRFTVSRRRLRSYKIVDDSTPTNSRKIGSLTITWRQCVLSLLCRRLFGFSFNLLFVVADMMGCVLRSSNTS